MFSQAVNTNHCYIWHRLAPISEAF